LVCFSLGFFGLPTVAEAAELKVSRAALERTLKQQLFSGSDGDMSMK